ncbi:hypothetical protein QGP82_22260 [Leptothoe sp. LEGE 181152]|nr:hypothetical protein [Leptothoe sp. LEGE 181152]
MLAGSNQTTAADATGNGKPTLAKGHDQGRNNKSTAGQQTL